MTDAEQLAIFQEWLAKHKALMFKIVRAYAFTPMDRDDLFQEVAIQAWRSIPAFRKESAVTTWLYRVSLNTAMSWSKKEKRKGQTESIDSKQHILTEDAEPDERLTWLYDEISRLDEIDRSIALLLLDGLSYEEMAAILGITQSNVGVKIHRIKKQLMNRTKEMQSWNSTK